MRVEFNVPTEVRGGKVRVTDDTRIRESLPTINYLPRSRRENHFDVHFGRPKGKPVRNIRFGP
jgi:phosphoglycerate kinase